MSNLIRKKENKIMDNISPLPWRIISQPINIEQLDIDPCLSSIVDKDQNNICLHWYREDMETFKPLPNAEANAQYITLCCNNFEALVDNTSRLLRIIDNTGLYYWIRCDMVKSTKKLLAKIESERGSK